MRIEHIALWTDKLEDLKNFYTTYFGASAGSLYHNPGKKFSSYFLSFGSGARLELMHRPEVEQDRQSEFSKGFTHLAISVGSEAAVDQLTDTIRKAGYTVAGEPRRTGDGYYESVIVDPDGNYVEITV